MGRNMAAQRAEAGRAVPPDPDRGAVASPLAGRTSTEKAT